MVKIEKDKKSREMLEAIKKGKLNLRDAISSFPEPDICIIDDNKESEEE